MLLGTQKISAKPNTSGEKLNDSGEELTVHHQMFKEECRNVIALLIKAKKEHYSNKIVECGTESNQLFKLAKHLIT